MKRKKEREKIDLTGCYIEITKSGCRWVVFPSGVRSNPILFTSEELSNLIEKNEEETES